MPCTESKLREMIQRHGGVIAAGGHTGRYHIPDVPLCLLELAAACLVEDGLLSRITDDPNDLDRPDYRAINDAPWSSREAATEPLIRLHIAFTDWGQWTEERRQRVVSQIVRDTVREIIAELPDVPDRIRDRCQAAATMSECAEAAMATAVAESAAWAAWAKSVSEDTAWTASAAAWAECAANAAAWAAREAAWAAKRATCQITSSSDRVLLKAVDIWCAAASL